MDSTYNSDWLKYVGFISRLILIIDYSSTVLNLLLIQKYCTAISRLLNLCKINLDSKL